MVGILRVVTVGAVLVVVLGLGAGAGAQERTKHSGTVVAFAAGAGTMTLAEIGPWRIRDGTTVITYRVIRVTPDTEFAIVGPDWVEADGPSPAYREESLEHGAVYVDDYVTVDCRHQGDELIAIRITVVDAPGGVTPDGAEDARMGTWTTVDDVVLADCALDVDGHDLPDVFATAARALADVMVDPATVPRDVERRVELAAEALDGLLYDWLAELVFMKDSEQLVFPDARLSVRSSPPSLEACLRGGRIDRARTILRADVKAVTFHQFVLVPRGAGWRARIVLDI